MRLYCNSAKMTYLILGLILFLGIHSMRIVADDFRTRTIARIGLNPWKGIYSVASLAGFVLICYGYGKVDPSVKTILQ